jgi:hypothetical protein
LLMFKRRNRIHLQGDNIHHVDGELCPFLKIDMGNNEKHILLITVA